MDRPVDSSTVLGYHYESCYFHVPAEKTDEQVRSQVVDKYKRKFGNTLEMQGWQVLAMDEPYIWTDCPHEVDEDRRPYRMWARVRRRPVELRVEVPDEAVPEMLKLGMSLT